MRYIFSFNGQLSSLILVTDPLTLSQPSVTQDSPGMFHFDSDLVPQAVIALSSSAGPLVATQLTVTPAPVGPTPRIPADCPFTPASPALPSGPTTMLTADAASYRITQSNMTLDLGGHRVNALTIADGVSRVRITNGVVGTLSMAMLNNASLPTRVNDVTVDHIRFVGGNTLRDGNSLRASRVLIADCTSVPASSPTALDGLHTCFLWLDPGSSDVVIQDCDLWTRGAEACLRLVSSDRTVVHSSKLGCSVDKHCYRIHGNNNDATGTPSTDSWISDCELRNRGLMIATLPDATGPSYDVVRRTFIRRVSIRMNPVGPGADASFGFPAATLTPDGRIRLQVADVQDVSIVGTWDALAYAQSVGASNPQLQWSFRNNTFTHV